MTCACALIAFASGVANFSFAAGPATIQYEGEYWSAPRWDSPWAEHRSFHCQVSASGDGSRYVRCEFRNFRFHIVPIGEDSEGSVYLGSEHAGFELDHKKRTATGGPCNRCKWLREPHDPGGFCLSAGRFGWKLIGQELIAGHSVLRYGQNGSQVAWAPALGWQELERSWTQRSITGIPWAGFFWRVSSYETGEPPPERFRVPDGYTVIPNPRL